MPLSLHLQIRFFRSLFKIYQKEFLEISVSTGLIRADALALAGDGTPVVTSHRERKKRICKCKDRYVLCKVEKDKGAFKNNFILLWLLTRNYRLRQD